MCPLCGNHVAHDNAVYFAQDCIVCVDVVESAKTKGYQVETDILEEWKQLMETNSNMERLETLSWLLYVAWYGYHRATYLDVEGAVQFWNNYLLELPRAANRCIYRCHNSLLQWFDDLDTFYKTRPT